MKTVSIGNILKNMRNINTKLSQKEIGEMLMLSDTTISSYERENSNQIFKQLLIMHKYAILKLRYTIRKPIRKYH